MTDNKITTVFRIKPESNTNRAVIKYIGKLNADEKLGDEIIELDTPLHPNALVVGKHAIPIKKIDSFDMVGRLYRCNIVSTHIVVSRRYPLMYLTVEYERPLVSGSLLQLFLSLDMDIKQKRKIMDSKNNAGYVGLTFTGSWYLHMDCDDELVENYERFLVKMLEDEASKLLASDCKYMDDNEICEWIENYVRTNRVFYDGLIKEREFKFTTINKMRDWFISLCQSENFNKFIGIAMKCREIYRRKQAGVEDNTPYIIPKNITKLADISNEIIDNDELILEDE
jgi:hypothetical protein